MNRGVPITPSVRFPPEVGTSTINRRLTFHSKNNPLTIKMTSIPQNTIFSAKEKVFTEFIISFLIPDTLPLREREKAPPSTRSDVFFVAVEKKFLTFSHTREL